MKANYEPMNLPITMWAEDDRPREKLEQKGRSALSDAELLAIILGSGSRTETAVELAKRILHTCDNKLHLLSKKNITELCTFHGVGPAKAINIIAALELGRRRSIEKNEETGQIRSSQDAFQILRRDIETLPHEEFWMLLIDRGSKVMAKERISIGGMNATVVDPRIVFRSALLKGACSIVVGHNHPSGAIKPSENDIRLTRKLKEGALLLEIGLLDHIIVGANTYFSFADEGLL